MADLFQGSAPPNVTTTRETAAVAPQYLTDYLTQLAQQGQQSLGTFDKTTGQYTTPTQEQLSAAGKPYVAPLSTLQQSVIQAAPQTLTRYQTPMDAALASGQAGAGIDQGDISKFYNPYEAAVVGDMATRSATNVQRNLMPQLQAGFVGTGGLGGQRYANALGQTLGDTETGLLQEQNKYKAAGYQSALDAALREMAGQTQSAQALGTLGAQEQQAATTGLKTGADIGAIEQAQNQALINAPTQMAGNVAQILRGYTYPTVTTEKTQGPASSYGPSILSQIGGLGSLIASGTNAKGTGFLDKFGNYVTGVLNNSSGSSGYGSNTPVSDYTNPILNQQPVDANEFGYTNTEG
jgi:hypothetical protein